MEIRPATLEERPSLRDLMVAAMEAAGPAFYSPTQTQGAARYLTDPDDDLIEDGTLYVVEIDGQLAGVGGWSSRRKLFTGSEGQEALSADRLNPKTEPARIRAFFVAPNFTRRGIARLLYNTCETAALAAGFTTLTLMATLPGVPLYRSLGFENESPCEIDLPNGSLLPCIEMQKKINLKSEI